MIGRVSKNLERHRFRRLWIASGWGILAAIIWLSLTPTPPKVEFEHGDKLGHLVAYGTLMFWFCQLYEQRWTRTAYAMTFCAMGIALEFVQGALGYRTYEELDMLANALGVLIGWAIALASGPRLFARIERLIRD